MLTTLVLFFTSQLVEVPLNRFDQLAQPRTIAAVALSPDAHTVSVWTRWSSITPCVLWTIDVQTGKSEGLGEDACPEPPPPPASRRLGESSLQGIPTSAQITVHPTEPLIALNLGKALTFAARADGRLISSFGHAGFVMKGVAASEGEWLLWVQNADGADRLYLADSPQLIAAVAEKPFVRAVSRITLPSSFGWKKDTKGTPDSPCDFFERAVMVDSVLLLDWDAASKPIEVRVRSQSGELQKWQVDLGSPTPVPGLQVERMQLSKQGRVRLRVRFPFVISALAITPSGAKVPKLGPVSVPVSTSSTEPHCVFTNGELKPERLMLDALLR